MDISHQGGDIKGKIVGVCMDVHAYVYLHICGVMGKVVCEPIYTQFIEFEEIRNGERETCRSKKQHQ